MPSQEPDLVIQMLRDPGSLQTWTPRQFDLLLRQASAADLVGRMAVLVETQGLTSALPPGLRDHLDGTRRLLRSHEAEVRRELAHIGRALEPLQVPVVLLKGAAYVAAGLPAARGRFFSDVDILVPKPRLPEVEDALLRHGWVTTKQSAYDQRYYREWMHELPPMVHIRRQTALDVHHAIAPETARWRTDSARLWQRALPLGDGSGFSVLAPEDMVLHSMVHLFLNEELSHGLRDLADIDQLLRHFGQDAGFWPLLAARAQELQLRRALFYGLRCVAEVLRTPVPEDARSATDDWGPDAVSRALMAAAWRRALRSPHPSAGQTGSPLARSVLYVRATWLRMPPRLLARHLVIKALGLNERTEGRPKEPA